MFPDLQWLLLPLLVHGVCCGGFVGVWYNQPVRSPHIYTSAIILHTEEALSACLNCSICFRFLDNLCNNIHSQIYPLIPSPSINYSLPRGCHESCLEVSWVHQTRNSSLLCWQSRSTRATSILTAWSTGWLFWSSSVGWLLGMWKSTWFACIIMFSTTRENSSNTEQ